MSDLKTIANALAEHCRADTTREGLNTLYADNAVSVEAVPMPGSDSAEAHGLAAIHAKHDWWDQAMEVHSATTEGPFFHGADRFALIFAVDATDRSTKERHAMHEVGIYTVADGKITREEFYYAI